jgi:FkbM family methyltransferase
MTVQTDARVVFDLGMHDGGDTAHYLASGCRVISVEANPELAARARERFADALAAGTLEIVEAAISDTPGTAEFWINPRKTVWSSLDRAIADRDSGGCVVTQVECVTLGQLIDAYGVPYFMKIDIEGADIHCLRALTPETAPEYLSVEAHRLEYLMILHGLGYRRFKVVDQTAHNDPWPYPSSTVGHAVARVRRRFMNRTFEAGSSGPFPEAAPRAWDDVESVAYQWLARMNGRGPLSRWGWFDFHAAR